MKYIVALFLLISPAYLYAGIFDKKLTIYKCDINKPSGCNEWCVKSDVTVEFMVDKKSKAVLSKSHYKNNTESSIYENCKIFDDKNWDCSSQASNQKSTVIYDHKTKMINGVFTTMTVIQEFKGASKKHEIEMYFCAK